jgi:hypothetical protein
MGRMRPPGGPGTVGSAMGCLVLSLLSRVRGRDMDRLFLALAVVDNNSATSVGGGGTPRQPLAPPFASQ